MFFVRAPKILVSLVAISWMLPSLALDINGNGPMRSDVVALYEFNNTTGNVIDTSGVAPALNLVIDNPGSVIRDGNSLDIETPTLIHSNGPAAKIISQCKSSNELTIEAWLENNVDEPPRPKPVRIVTLSNQLSNDPAELSSTNRNFFLGQTYDDNNRFTAFVRTSNSRDGAEVITDPDVSLFKKLQHVYVTRDAQGVLRMYVSQEYVDPTTGQTRYIDVQRETVLSDESRGTFANWADDMILGIGNEISYQNPNAQTDPVEDKFTTEERAWLGKIHLLAIYCKALTPTDIAGDAAPGNKVYPRIRPRLGDTITYGREMAALLFKRLSGVATSIDHPVIVQMGQLIDAGDWMGAADLASQERDFYNIVVRDFAARMSTRDETVNAPLSDFIATVVGVTRDEIDARKLLNGNFLYRGDPALAAVSSDIMDDIIRSNNHYDELESGNFDLSRVLVRVNGQPIFNSGNVVNNPDPAGVITSRAFMEAHAVAGTNRRIVEFAFSQFLCKTIDQWADGSMPDDYVGRDVDRYPGGDNNEFNSKCSTCHAVMDPLRQAFSRLDFSNGIIKYAPYFTNADNDDDINSVDQDPPGIVQKMNRNADTFPAGFPTTSDSFVNRAVAGANKEYFQWGSTKTGSGPGDFGQMMSESKAFPTCMAHRVFRSVCKREPEIFDEDMINNAAKDFQIAGYNLRHLFKTIAVSKECIGR